MLNCIPDGVSAAKSPLRTIHEHNVQEAIEFVELYTPDLESKRQGKPTEASTHAMGRREERVPALFWLSRTPVHSEAFARQVSQIQKSWLESFDCERCQVKR